MPEGGGGGGLFVGHYGSALYVLANSLLLSC